MSLTKKEIEEFNHARETVDRLLVTINDAITVHSFYAPGFVKSATGQALFEEFSRGLINASNHLKDVKDKIDVVTQQAFIAHVKIEDADGKVVLEVNSVYPEFDEANEYMEDWKNQGFALDGLVACEAWIELPDDRGWVVFIGDREMSDSN